MDAAVEIREARSETEEADAAELMAAYLSWARSSCGSSTTSMRLPRIQDRSEPGWMPIKHRVVVCSSLGRFAEGVLEGDCEEIARHYIPIEARIRSEHNSGNRPSPMARPLPLAAHSLRNGKRTRRRP